MFVYVVVYVVVVVMTMYVHLYVFMYVCMYICAYVCVLKKAGTGHARADALAGHGALAGHVISRTC